MPKKQKHKKRAQRAKQAKPDPRAKALAKAPDRSIILENYRTVNAIQNYSSSVGYSKPAYNRYVQNLQAQQEAFQQGLPEVRLLLNHAGIELKRELKSSMQYGQAPASRRAAVQRRVAPPKQSRTRRRVSSTAKPFIKVRGVSQSNREADENGW